MLDVDGQVIPPAELVQRVEQLLGSIDVTGIAPEGPGRAFPDPQAAATYMVAQVHAMRALQARISPPDIGSATGVRGQAARFTKRAIRKFTKWYVEPRWVLQQDYDGNNVEFASEVYNALQRLDRELDDLRRHSATLRLQMVSFVQRVSKRQKEFISSVSDQVQEAVSQDDLRVVRTELSQVLERLGAASSAGADIDYVAFEDKFRGPTEEVRESQEHYLSVFPPADTDGRILDIGCGRGEMLELLRMAGHDVLGVDPDEGMVEVCRAKGLPVVHDDGIHQLHWVDDDSLKGVFCAQVVEHLLTSELQQLVRLALTKLRPGGVLVMETINPRSLFALGNHFFADTSHVRPVHPETLRFICEQAGFGSVELQELSPHDMLEAADDLPEGSSKSAIEGLLRSVFGFQDYAIVATK